ncbi:hypothetical protein STEG23_031903 [Scotinomys teguina]
MSESDSKEKGNLKEERPKSSKASSKLHTKVEKEKETDQGKKEKETDQGKKEKETDQGKKEKETDQGKTKQKPSGLYPVLDKFADINLSDSAEEDRRIGCASRLDQENPIWIPERLTHFIRHEDPDPDTSDKPDSSPDQSRTGDAVVGSDQNVADPDANLMRPEMKAE